MLLKKGDLGHYVKEWQKVIGTPADGAFGPNTEKLTIAWQKKHGLVADGIVGRNTWEAAGIDTDSIKGEVYETEYTTKDGLVIDKAYLDKDEYVRDYGKIEPLGFFIHHTAGWDNPYNTINSWNKDKRGRVATQYCIGGTNVKGNLYVTWVINLEVINIGMHIQINKLKACVYCYYI